MLKTVMCFCDQTCGHCMNFTPPKAPKQTLEESTYVYMVPRSKRRTNLAYSRTFDLKASKARGSGRHCEKAVRREGRNLILANRNASPCPDTPRRVVSSGRIEALYARNTKTSPSYLGGSVQLCAISTIYLHISGSIPDKAKDL